MNTQITRNQSLKDIEELIRGEVSCCEFWGDLQLSQEEFEALGDCIRKSFCSTGVNVEILYKNFPHCTTTYMVFFAVYKYNANFWGALAEDLNTSIPQPLQESLGTCARRMFVKYKMDFSDSKDEVRVNIAPIIYEACIPPDSSLDDLFYILSYDAYGLFDPQLIIDDLIDMRSYAIRKPLLRFLTRFKGDRAVDYILEVYDAIISAEQKNSIHSRYTDSYYEWKLTEKSRQGVSSRKEKEHQTRPYLFFDEGRKGLAIMLPRIIVESEWIDTAKWIVSAPGGFRRTVECNVFGDEGRRFTDILSVSVPAAEQYTIKLQDSELFDDKPMTQWDIQGIPADKPVWFNNNGRQVNANYILSPYGILIFHSSIDLSELNEVGIEEQYYPYMTESYRIVSVTPLGSDARLVFDCHGKSIELLSRPQIKLELHGKHLFNVEALNLFTEIPQLIIETEGSVNRDALELRIGNSVCSVVFSEDCTTIDLVECTHGELKSYGTYSVRLYQHGRFLKQIEFNYVPLISSNYSPTLYWPANRTERNTSKNLRFKRLKEWELSFEGCNVNFDEETCIVDVPSSVGAIPVSLQSLSDEFTFRCSFELPVYPFEYDVVSLNGEAVEKTSKLYRTDLKSLTDEELWFSLRTYGSFTEKDYSLALKTINGFDQIEAVKLNNKGSGNINLSSFYDTIRNSPLPLEIVLICDDIQDEGIPVIYVSEANSFTSPVRLLNSEKRDYVLLDAEDDGKDIDVLRFGFNKLSFHLTYEHSKLSKNGESRGYPLPERLVEGFYMVSGDKNESFFDIDEDSFSFDQGNGLIYVRCPREDNHIKTSKHLLDLLLKDILNKKTAGELKEAMSYKILTVPSMLSQIEIVQLDDFDIERLVAIAYIANEKIEKNKKKLLEQLMRRISVSLMKRGDRYRIIELLSDLETPQEVFDTCLKEYSLLLFYSDNSERQLLAGKIEKYSPELAMVLMMSTDGSIRDCMWKEKYIDLIGKDAIKHMLYVPKYDDTIDPVTEQKRFIREEPENYVSVRVDDQIAGNLNAIQGMITFDKWGTPKFDVTRKPDYGLYFHRIKYVDQYVNWYKNTHDKNDEIYPEIRSMMNAVVEEYGEKILNCINDLNKHVDWKWLSKPYLEAVGKRTDPSASKSSYGWFFYLQGVAAFLTRLPIDRKYDDKRKIGIKFMSEASVIAPKLSQRDILMAQVYIYLKRKEESLCQ